MNTPTDARKNVIVCEDDPVQLRLFTALFEQAGYRSLAARSPAEALSIAARFSVDAVLTDVQLRDGNGFDLVGELKQIGLDAPVIMASAYATEGMKARARSAGVRCFLEKPLDLGQIRRHVSQAIRETGRRQPRALIVEGRGDVRSRMEEAAGRAGFAVLASDSGVRALDLLRTSSSPVDLLVVDFHAAGVSGVEMIREALRIRPDLHVVVATGEASRDEIRAAYEAGAASLVRKPIPSDRLEAIFRQALMAARSRQERAARRRAREGRQAAAPWRVKMARALRKFRHRATATVAAASLLIGVTLAYSLAWGAETWGRYEKMAEAVLPGAARAFDGSREDKAFARWQQVEQLNLLRQANDATRRYYEEHIQEMKWQRASRIEPLQAAEEFSFPVPTPASRGVPARVR